MKQVLLALILVCQSAFAITGVFTSDWTLWKSPTISILTAGESGIPISAEDFCIGIARVNPSLAKPECRIAGDWERDSIAMVYGRWLALNLDPRIKPEYLQARHPAAMEKLRALDDQYLMTLSIRNDTLWTALFTGSTIQPVAAAFLTPIPKDSRELAEQVAPLWFNSSPVQRLTPEQKKALAIAPDDSYAPTPPLDTWVGIGFGYSQGSIPLTPKNWYQGKLNDRIQKYRTVRDSLSVWSFLEDESQVLRAQAGFTWNGFIGTELFLAKTSHAAKIDKSDTLYNELDHWTFSRYEVGLTAHVNHLMRLSHGFETNLYGFLGFHYSYLFEDIGLKDLNGALPSQSYERRIRFLPFYKGALFGVGNRLVWKGKLALDARAGISNRGRSLDREPSPDAAPTPTLIGGSTLDCFAAIAFEYHFRPAVLSLRNGTP
jgi:hypothetical protein